MEKWLHKDLWGAILELRESAGVLVRTVWTPSCVNVVESHGADRMVDKARGNTQTTRVAFMITDRGSLVGWPGPNSCGGRAVGRWGRIVCCAHTAHKACARPYPR